MTLHRDHRFEVFEKPGHEQNEFGPPVSLTTFACTFVTTLPEITLDIFLTIIDHNSVVSLVIDYVVTSMFNQMIIVYTLSILLPDIQIMKLFIYKQIIHYIFIRLIEYTFKIDYPQSILVQIYVVHTLR